MDKYRITVPEIHQVESAVMTSDRTVPTMVNTVLWTSDHMPDTTTIDQILEGQTESLRSQHNGSEGPYKANNEIYVQKQKRPRILGWRTVSVINIPE